MRERLIGAFEELHEQRAALVQMNQLKSELVATLAHDLRGPLTSIVGFAELLEEGYLEGEEAAEAARTIRANAQRLATFTNDLLALARVESSELEIADEQFDAVDVLKGAIEAANGEREINLHLEVEDALVRGDAERLRSVFDHLLSNALKYSPGGEPVSVDVVPNEDSFAFTVTDLGIGIPLEDLPRLFNRFGRASNARRMKIAGTGVGLFIVKAIVERHGGTVHVESTLDHGSAFTVRLPSAQTRSARLPRVTILCGDRRLSRYTALELRSRGYRIREANTIIDAIEGMQAGDVMIADTLDASAQELRDAIEVPAQIIGIGAEPSDGWDASLPKPFLLSDLIAALDGKP